MYGIPFCIVAFLALVALGSINWHLSLLKAVPAANARFRDEREEFALEAKMRTRSNRLWWLWGFLFRLAIAFGLAWLFLVHYKGFGRIDWMAVHNWYMAFSQYMPVVLGLWIILGILSAAVRGIWRREADLCAKGRLDGVWLYLVLAVFVGYCLPLIF